MLKKCFFWSRNAQNFGAKLLECSPKLIAPGTQNKSNRSILFDLAVCRRREKILKAPKYL